MPWSQTPPSPLTPSPLTPSPKAHAKGHAVSFSTASTTPRGLPPPARLPPPACLPFGHNSEVAAVLVEHQCSVPRLSLSPASGVGRAAIAAATPSPPSQHLVVASADRAAARI